MQYLNVHFEHIIHFIKFLSFLTMSYNFYAIPVEATSQFLLYNNTSCRILFFHIIVFFLNHRNLGG